MKLNLTELVNLKVVMTRHLEQLKQERNNVMYILSDKETVPELNYDTVKDLSLKINEVIYDIALAESILHQENSKVQDGKTITGCISFIKRMREELSQYQKMAIAQPKAPQYGYRGEGLVQYANFNPLYWKEKARITEYEINTISRYLDRRNFNTEVEVPFANKYI